MLANAELVDSIRNCLLKCLMSINETYYERAIIDILQLREHANKGYKNEIFILLNSYFSTTKKNLLPYIDHFISTLVEGLNEIPMIIENCWTTWGSIVKLITPTDLCRHIHFIRMNINGVYRLIRQKDLSASATYIPAFTISHSTHPIWDIIQVGLRSTSADIRLESAECLKEIYTYSNNNTLNTMVCKTMTGVLIRGVGDKLSDDIRGILMDSLNLLLVKGDSLAFKTFFPQLQSTLLKNLNDKSNIVRNKTIRALIKYSEISGRNELILRDLESQLKAQQSNSIADITTIIRAIRSVLLVTQELPNSINESLSTELVKFVVESNREIIKLISSCISQLIYLGKSLPNYVNTNMNNSNDLQVLSSIFAVKSLCHHNQTYCLDNISLLLSYIKNCIKSTETDIKLISIECIYFLYKAYDVNKPSYGSKTNIQQLNALLSELMVYLNKNQPPNIVTNSMKCVKRFIEIFIDDILEYIIVLIPPILEIAQNTVGSSKFLAEKSLSLLLLINNSSNDIKTNRYEYVINTLSPDISTHFKEYYTKVLKYIKITNDPSKSDYDTDEDNATIVTF